jgi:hypothetical protein
MDLVLKTTTDTQLFSGLSKFVVTQINKIKKEYIFAPFFRKNTGIK